MKTSLLTFIFDKKIFGTTPSCLARNNTYLNGIRGWLVDGLNSFTPPADGDASSGVCLLDNGIDVAVLSGVTLACGKDRYRPLQCFSNRLELYYSYYNFHSLTTIKQSKLWIASPICQESVVTNGFLAQKDSNDSIYKIQLFKNNLFKDIQI